LLYVFLMKVKHLNQYESGPNALATNIFDLRVTITRIRWFFTAREIYFIWKVLRFFQSFKKICDLIFFKNIIPFFWKIWGIMFLEKIIPHIFLKYLWYKFSKTLYLTFY